MGGSAQGIREITNREYKEQQEQRIKMAGDPGECIDEPYKSQYQKDQDYVNRKRGLKPHQQTVAQQLAKSFNEPKNNPRDKKLIVAFLPEEYIRQIEIYFMENGKAICHNRNGTRRLVLRGERLDWSSNFYERPLQKENDANMAKPTTKVKRPPPEDSITCYVK